MTGVNGAGSQRVRMAGECPSGCGRSLKVGHLMCGPCWREVPADVQREVNRTWRAYSKAAETLRAGGKEPGGLFGPDGAERAKVVREKRRAYQEARDRAIGSVA